MARFKFALKHGRLQGCRCYDSMDGIGKSSREQRPRATHDHMDVGGRILPGAYLEQLPATIGT